MILWCLEPSNSELECIYSTKSCKSIHWIVNQKYYSKKKGSHLNLEKFTSAQK